jgi:hypothetical protein
MLQMSMSKLGLKVLIGVFALMFSASVGLSSNMFKINDRDLRLTMSNLSPLPYIEQHCPKWMLWKKVLDDEPGCVDKLKQQ